MPFLLQYIIKVSISLGIVYLFYLLILRKLTFHHSNRLYLLGYTFLSFFIAFINITPVLEENELVTNGMVQSIPVIDTYTDTLVYDYSWSPIAGAWDKWDWTVLVLGLGIMAFLFQFFTRLISFYMIRRNAKLVSSDTMKLYQVDKPIIPFSFGNSIFINRELHNEKELEEIILHEFVHVKQKHTIDIIWSELLCIFNWFNPFAWLLRKAIRQNLEFIADRQVLDNGIDKKEYQYLLLKVIGVSRISIASQFNFSSLKKRIAMMNKIKSARMHLLKFAFILPLVAVLLLAFRDRNGNSSTATELENLHQQSLQNDTVPDAPANSKGYYIDIKDNKGNCTVVVRSKNKKELERVDLLKWNEKKEYYENLYGEILAPPHFERPVIAVVTSADGATKVVSANVANTATAQTTVVGNVTTSVAGTITGTVNTNQEVGVTVARAGVNTMQVSSQNVSGNAANTTQVATANKITGVIAQNGNTTIASANNSQAISSVNGNVDVAETITPAEKVLELRIYKTMTREELNKIIADARSKGVELKFDEIEYNDKGILTSISGSMKRDDAKSNFNADGFEVIRLALYKTGKKYSIRIHISDKENVSRVLPRNSQGLLVISQNGDERITERLDSSKPHVIDLP